MRRCQVHEAVLTVILKGSPRFGTTEESKAVLKRVSFLVGGGFSVFAESILT